MPRTFDEAMSEHLPETPELEILTAAVLAHVEAAYRKDFPDGTARICPNLDPDPSRGEECG